MRRVQVGVFLFLSSFRYRVVEKGGERKKEKKKKKGKREKKGKRSLVLIAHGCALVPSHSISPNPPFLRKKGAFCVRERPSGRTRKAEKETRWLFSVISCLSRL